MNLKQILKIAVDENVPEILELRASIEKDTVEKNELQARINQINIDIDAKTEKLTSCETVPLSLMGEHNVKKLITSLYAVERCQNANPTVEVIDLNALPKRFIVERPKADKRLIQTEFVNSKTVPPGVSIGYGQYLKIIERRK